MKKTLVLLIKILSRILTSTLLLIPHKKTKFIFTSKYGFSDNSKYLFLYYLKQGVSCTWVASCNDSYKEVSEIVEKFSNATVIKRNSLKAIPSLARAKYIFVTHSFQDLGITAIKTCPIVNLWHGIPIKKMGYDSQNDINLFSLNTHNPYKINDYVISSSEITKPFSMSCMDLHSSKVLPLGQPRNDFLEENINNQILINQLKSNYSSKNKSRIILYAPTFRDKGSNALDIYIGLINSFKDYALKDDFLVLRLHPKEKELLADIELPKNIKHSQIGDVQEELLSADILISDYSSIIFDFSLLQKPILLYTPDREEYFVTRGGSYFEYDKTLQECTKIQDEQINSIWSSNIHERTNNTQLTQLHAELACKSIFQQFN